MEEEDEFWKVALSSSGDHQQERTALCFQGDGPDDDEDSNDSVQDIHDSRPILYEIPWRKDRNSANNDDDQTASIELNLSPLPDHSGIWSPLGAQAWYASSLLVAYMLQGTIIINQDETAQECSFFSRYVKARLYGTNESDSKLKTKQFTALELGSGAVGLAGMVLGLILADLASFSGKCEENGEDSHHMGPVVPRVIMTDNDPEVVEHLQHNVKEATRQLENQESKRGGLARISVELLDWNHYETSSLSHQEGNDIQLVVGSELVYTHDTAQACAKVVLALLQDNPDVLIFILQVTDRDGWSNVFLPIVRKNSDHDVVVLEESVQNSDLHELASSMIPQGGTLDRFAFGSCYIFNKSNPSSDNIVRHGE